MAKASSRETFVIKAGEFGTIAWELSESATEEFRALAPAMQDRFQRMTHHRFAYMATISSQLLKYQELERILDPELKKGLERFMSRLDELIANPPKPQ